MELLAHKQVPQSPQMSNLTQIYESSGEREGPSPRLPVFKTTWTNLNLHHNTSAACAPRAADFNQTSKPHNRNDRRPPGLQPSVNNHPNSE